MALPDCFELPAFGSHLQVLGLSFLFLTPQAATPAARQNSREAEPPPRGQVSLQAPCIPAEPSQEQAVLWQQLRPLGSHCGRC